MTLRVLVHSKSNLRIFMFFCSMLVIGSSTFDSSHFKDSHFDFRLHTFAAITIEVPIDHGICQNWTEAVEANAGNCSYSLHTLHCFGGMSNVDL